MRTDRSTGMVVEITSLAGRHPVVPHPHAELRGLQRDVE